MRFNPATISVYIHFPYCLYKCHYCDFNSYAVNEDHALFDRYIDGLERELQWRLAYNQTFTPGTPLGTLFFGGGTPSLLLPEQLDRLIMVIQKIYPPLAHCEVTVECNPKTLTPEKIAGYRTCGVNRLSIGIQSFKNKYLAPLGRIHSGQEAFDTLTLVAETGFPNVNTDLIFGFPGQTVEEVLEDLATAAAFRFSHLSFYGLTPEPGTPFYRDIMRERVHLPEDDVQLIMMEQGKAFLDSQGFLRYEVSNFHRRGASPSHHNLAYWNYRPFLGMGAGATGFLYGPEIPSFGRRHLNVKSPQVYLQKAGNEPTYEEEIIDELTAMKEWIMMGLRKSEGFCLDEFAQLFPTRSFHREFGTMAREMQAKGWLLQIGDKIRTTEIGMQFLNDLTGHFF